MTEIIKQMIFAAYMAAKEGWPKCYLWHAIWWRLHANESANPIEPIWAARNQLRLYRDIIDNPEHYRREKRIDAGKSDWQIYCDRCARRSAQY